MIQLAPSSDSTALETGGEHACQSDGRVSVNVAWYSVPSLMGGARAAGSFRLFVSHSAHKFVPSLCVSAFRGVGFCKTGIYQVGQEASHHVCEAEGWPQ